MDLPLPEFKLSEGKIRQLVATELDLKVSIADDQPFHYVEITAPPGAGKSVVINSMTELLELQSRNTVTIVLDDIVSHFKPYNDEILAAKLRWMAGEFDAKTMIAQSNRIYRRFQGAAERIEAMLLREAREKRLNVIYERNLWIKSDKAFLDHVSAFHLDGATTTLVGLVASKTRLEHRVEERAKKIGRFPNVAEMASMMEFHQQQMVDTYTKFDALRVFDADFDFAGEQNSTSVAAIEGTPFKKWTFKAQSICPTDRLSELAASHTLLPVLANVLQMACRQFIGEMPVGIRMTCNACGLLARRQCGCGTGRVYCNTLCHKADWSQHSKDCSAVKFG